MSTGGVAGGARQRHGVGMNATLRSLLDRHHGLLERATVLQVVPSWVLDRATGTGELVRLLPGVYADARLLPPAAPTDPPTDQLDRLEPGQRHRAAALYAAGRGVLSSRTALHIWGVRDQPPGEPLHLDVPVRSGLRSRRSLIVHQRPASAVVRGGVPVTPLEHSLIRAWPMLTTAERTQPVIRAVNDRRTTPERIDAALAAAPRLGHRAELRALLARLAAGCRSPLEIWGHDHVFVGPSMPAFRRQERIRVGGRVYYLDMYAEAERVDIELDGATAHGDPRQRELDLRRDAALAAVGILVLRFAHRRLVYEVEQVRRETVAVLRSRRGSQHSGAG